MLTIEGLSYLLAYSEQQKQEWVTRYNADELAEVFTADQLTTLRTSGRVEITTRHGILRYVDMLSASRNAATAH